MKFYKFLCPFAKIITLFTESLEKGLDKVVSRGEKNFSVHRKYMNFLRPRKTALDEPLYKLSAGRSMVEMLGVLAIIGVLSVGAIAGYSKAMMKYKLNKQAESMNMLINNALQLAPQLNRSFTGTNFNTDIFNKLNLIPDGMKYDSNYGNSIIYDIFNNNININYYTENVSKNIEYNIVVNMATNGKQITDDAVEICRNIVNVAKDNHSNINSLQMRAYSTSSNNFSNILYGDSKCNNNQKCLKNATVSDIDQFCSNCEADIKCSLYIFLPTNN